MKPLKKLKRLLSQAAPGGDTSERVTKSAFWLFGQKMGGRMIQLAMMVLLARLIGPAELGLVGIALLAVDGLRRLTEIGLNAALIQREEDDVDHMLDTSWTLEIARGVLIAALLFAAAPVVASVFNEPRATDLLRVVGLSPLLLAFRNPAIIYFQKNLEFHKEFGYTISAEVAQFLVAVGFALVSPTAWAFVAGYLVADLVRISASYYISSYRPSVSFDREVAKDLIGYGKWMTGSSILFFLYDKGDDAFVGWFLGSTTLAFYQYAHRFSNAPATELSGVLAGVMFPAMSKLQDDPVALRNGFLKAIRLTAFITFPATVGIALVTPSFVYGFLGPDWAPMILPMQILCIYGLVRSLGRTFGPLWNAVGRPDILTKMSSVNVILLAVFIYPVTDAFGLAGTAALIVGINLFVVIPIDIVIIVRMLETDYYSIARQLVYPLVASAVMAAGTLAVTPALDIAPVIEFFVLIVVGAVLYVVTAALFEVSTGWGIGNDLRTIVTRVRS
jgi:PST family polysaccharide transporter/lipopolysaccharide exporter